MLTVSFNNKALTIKAPHLIGGSLVTGLVLAALALYFCYLCLLAILLGTQLVVSTFNQLSALISGTPVLHFLFVLGLVCLVVCVTKWMINQTRRYVYAEVRHGRI